MEGRRVRRDEGEEKKNSSDAGWWTRGGNVFGEEGSERTPSSFLTALYVQSGPTVCVWWATGGCARDGQPSSQFKKKKEENKGIYNSPLIEIISDQPQGASSQYYNLAFAYANESYL
jgi:hypothetical protein